MWHWDISNIEVSGVKQKGPHGGPSTRGSKRSREKFSI